ncbi:hypothetical protein THASP1DRAFT_22244 [Thamnocephalis sphaerospora]|uniref:Uncharacterized protein n=1 Tax=Thamnocephalis sphaerospora TaxID=78915 RepID=A0A4P9XUQ8_9FUNG|nr:hypothetical protein THASP1DRAFT_22244 [Thamnocephalis sphaerospora]|eukprot:RKP09977.1 hypothetical protein THASP1DRAFT_22244 [Thamnocephalis sphaerospora]
MKYILAAMLLAVMANTLRYDSGTHASSTRKENQGIVSGCLSSDIRYLGSMEFYYKSIGPESIRIRDGMAGGVPDVILSDLHMITGQYKKPYLAMRSTHHKKMSRNAMKTREATARLRVTDHSEEVNLGLVIRLADDSGIKVTKEGALKSTLLMAEAALDTINPFSRRQ